MITGIVILLFGCGTTPRTDNSTARPATEDRNMEKKADGMENGAVAGSLPGIWQGVITAGGQEIRLVFHFALEGEVWSAALDSPDQGAYGIPAESMAVDGTDITVDVPAAAAVYEGVFDPAKATIRGTWSQGGGSFSVNLERIEKVEVITRPQDPVPPFPYDQREVTFTNTDAGITLAGTLTLPRTGGPFPGVILISGSGAQNRDEEIMNHRPFLVLADHLTREGIAVLRYDDRGVGGSGGDPETATSRDFAGDAYAAYSFLANQPGIDPAKTGIIGHSEGGIIAPMIAAEHPDVAFIVLLAAPGFPGSELLLQQSAAILKASGATNEQIIKSAEINREIYDVVVREPDNQKAADEIGGILEGLGIPDDRIEQQLSPLLTPWYRFFITHDPATDLMAITCPVLAITGSLDLQVPADENLAKIETSLKSGGNDMVVTKKLERLNHLFQTAQTGLVEEYARIEETFAPVALRAISEWIADITR